MRRSREEFCYVVPCDENLRICTVDPSEKGQLEFQFLVLCDRWQQRVGKSQ